MAAPLKYLPESFKPFEFRHRSAPRRPQIIMRMLRLSGFRVIYGNLDGLSRCSANNCLGVKCSVTLIEYSENAKTTSGENETALNRL